MTTLTDRRGRRRLRVTGVVQGVGFRPFVHRLATDLRLDGWVGNDAAGVTIEIEGPIETLDIFAERLKADAPKLAMIEAVESDDVVQEFSTGFRISRSQGSVAHPVVSVPPDTALCDDCLAELRDPDDRRHRHPFITCTNCGPRFTIITGLPYDRPSTTMLDFALCPACSVEYHDPADRRHHAQPLACRECGPTLRHRKGSESITGADSVLAAVHHDLAAGSVVALKGVGGYHLVVSAIDDAAVARLRHRKQRVDKPFAVMVPDLAAARLIAHVDEDDAGLGEASALTSPARPIVLLRARPGSPLSPLVAPGNPLIGVMLPYSPLHHLLFAPVPGHPTTVPEALVVTSGNAAGEPICHDDDDAAARLTDVADTFCTHDRPIHVPCDDSVVRVIGGTEVPLRRSRGYAPLPVHLPFDTVPILGVGGEIKNTFCLARGHHAFMSQHLGDMENLPSLGALERSVALLGDLYGIAPAIVATDLHPGYHTRRWAMADAADTDDLRVVGVQHHHAHLAALMVEHGLADTDPIIGVVFDGTGFGHDGALWGGEILVGGYGEVERRGHLAPVSLPGGEAAIRAPWKTALAHLRAAGVEHEGVLDEAADATARRAVLHLLERGLACVPTTSMGRLFDAVASLLGVRHHITYEAQAAIELEHLAAEAPIAGPGMGFSLADDLTFDAAPVIRELVHRLEAGVDRGSLAFAFHRAVADLVADVADAVRLERGLSAVGLTGGVFQNDLLTRITIEGLELRGFTVLTHRVVPPNDGGIALGQVAVASHQPTTKGGC